MQLPPPPAEFGVPRSRHVDAAAKQRHRPVIRRLAAPREEAGTFPRAHGGGCPLRPVAESLALRCQAGKLMPPTAAAAATTTMTTTTTTTTTSHTRLRRRSSSDGEELALVEGQVVALLAKAQKAAQREDWAEVMALRPPAHPDRALPPTPPRSSHRIRGFRPITPLAGDGPRRRSGAPPRPMPREGAKLGSRREGAAAERPQDGGDGRGAHGRRLEC